MKKEKWQLKLLRSLSSMLDETLGRLEFVADKSLFAVVTADVGCGKTTAIRKLTSTLDPDQYTVLYLSDSKLTPRWFYKGLLDQLGIESRFYRGDAKRQLHQQLEVIRGVYKKNVVTIVDEAHLLGKETLEEIRFLLNYP
jgi:type II secretory pathway predicted ATPase ExeA